VFTELKRPVGRCRTAAAVLPHAGIADVEGRLVETLRALDLSLDRDVLEHLTSWYGTEASEVIRHASARHQLDRLADTSAVLTGEVSYAVRNSQARRLSDAVLRRTPLGSAGHPGQPALARAAAVMAAELNWTAEHVVQEIADVERVYPSSAVTGR
jgi:glycerol-3-phosphate dehydrogenase